MKVKDLLTDESKWVKRFYACDVHNNEVQPRSAYATKWCLLGAISYCYDYNKRLIIIKMIWDKLGMIHLDIWNDYTTFDKIKELINELDI